MSSENKVLFSAENSSLGGGLFLRSIKPSEASLTFFSRIGSSTTGASKAALFLGLDLVAAVLAMGGLAVGTVLAATVPFVDAFKVFFALENVLVDCFFGYMVQKGNVSG